MNRRLTALLQGMMNGKGYVIAPTKAQGVQEVSGEVAKGPKNLFGPGSTDHEIQAAKSGFVPSCCGNAANTKLQG